MPLLLMHCSLGAGSTAALVDQLGLYLLEYLAPDLPLGCVLLSPLYSFWIYIFCVLFLVWLSTSQFWYHRVFEFFGLLSTVLLIFWSHVDLMSYIFLPTGSKYYLLIDLLDGCFLSWYLICSLDFPLPFHHPVNCQHPSSVCLRLSGSFSHHFSLLNFLPS